MDGCSGNWFTGNWTPQENEFFENALAIVPEDAPDRWQRIAIMAGKSPAQVLQHYEKLLHDVSEIESGRIELPNYGDGSAATSRGSDQQGSGTPVGSKGKAGERERRKGGVLWTEEEHRSFLAGLQKYGKGHWSSISRNAVTSKTPKQVGSHAQRYLMRLKLEKKDKKRRSIHDITTVDDTSLPHSPIDDDQRWAISSIYIADYQPTTGSYTGRTVPNPHKALVPRGLIICHHQHVCSIKKLYKFSENFVILSFSLLNNPRMQTFSEDELITCCRKVVISCKPFVQH